MATHPNTAQATFDKLFTEKAVSKFQETGFPTEGIADFHLNSDVKGKPECYSHVLFKIKTETKFNGLKGTVSIFLI